MCTKYPRVFLIFLFVMLSFPPVQSSGEPAGNYKKYNFEKIKNSLKSQKAKFSETNASNLVKMKDSLMLQKTSLKEMKESYRKIDPRVRNYISGRKAKIKALQSKMGKSREQSSEKVKLVLKLKDEKAGLSHSMEKYGGRIIKKRHNLLAVEVPVDKIEQLAEENNAVERARFPFKLYPHGDVSEGVEITNADIFHDTVYKGAGVKVAVIDVGFMGLTDAISNGDLPQDVVTHDFSGLGLETEYVHGTGCAEIVHDMAPEAELHLIKVGDETENWDLMEYCIDNGIDIISMSLGTFGSGPGDGTGDFDEVFDEIREAGVLVVNSVGNSGNFIFGYLPAGTHWEGVFDDYDDDGYHEFDESISYSDYNLITAYPDQKDDESPETDEVTIVMRWNGDWSGTDIDYDMYIVPYNLDAGEGENPFGEIPNWHYVSDWPQDGDDPPLEVIQLDIPDEEDYLHGYALFVEIYQGSSEKLEIFLGGTSMFIPIGNKLYATSSGSVGEPADAESVLAVGAIDYTNWTTGPQEDFSSQGPTNAWNGSSARIKPDIMGPDSVTTYAYGNIKGRSFSGTSAAAPHVAGLAALFLSMYPGLTPDELQQVLEENAVDLGGSGKDNIYGWGRIETDNDYDGMLNAWETKYGLDPSVNDSEGDPDDDDYTNINEFKAGTFPNDSDSDDDGIIDGEEDVNHNGILDPGETDPTDSDTDDDGMPDGWEVEYDLDPLTDDAADDADGDGFSNLEEYSEGTIPNDAQSRPSRFMPWLPLLLEE